jgi:hypothetical protein
MFDTAGAKMVRGLKAVAAARGMTWAKMLFGDLHDVSRTWQKCRPKSVILAQYLADDLM